MFLSTGLALNLTTPSPLTRRRELVALLRGPMPTPTQYLATQDFRRLDNWHVPMLAKLPEPSDAQKNDFGMQESGQFSVDVPMPTENAPYIDVADNKAVDLDGVNDKIGITNAASINFGTGSFTIVARIKHRDFTYPKSTMSIQKAGTGGWNTSAGWGIGAGYNAAALYVFAHDGTNFAGTNIALDAGYQPPAMLNQFVDIAVIFDRSAAVNKARVVVNGVLQSGSLDLTALTGSVSNTNVLEIGTAVGWLLDGLVDECQAWARALSFSEIAATLRKRLKGNEPGLAMLLRCDEGAGVAANDATANVNNGALQNGATWGAGAQLDARDQFARLPTILKNQPVDLDLLARVYREDGTVVDFINERRGFVKSVTRKREGITLNVVDVDRVAMKTMFPIKTFTIADWPLLFVDHVNRCVCQGVGLGEKVPCTYVDNTAGAYKYAVCEIPAGTVAPTVLTVYRGKQSGQGQIVPSTEYVVSQTTVAGTTYLLLTFTREQVDFDNQKFVIEADVNSPISRVAADEIARLLQLVGLSIDAADFADAAAYHLTVNAKVDAWYTKQVSIDAIITPLLQAARGWLSQTLGGLYSIFVDRPRTAQRLLWDDSDEIQVDERSEPEVARTITLRYRPRPGQRSDYAGDLNRTTTGANGEKIFTNEFVRDHDTADRLLDYLAKKEARAAIKATLYGVVLTPGELCAINSPLVFDGWKSLAAESITRVADGCQVVGEEYTESDYTYTPGTLPADATNVYSPDYSYTPPAAPLAVSVVSSGCALNVEGTGVSYALIRATPPAVNWAKLTAQIKNNTTNEVYQAQLVLNGGNYEATIPGLRPGQAHTVVAWATNANGIDGATLAVVGGHTAATYGTAPAAPTGVTAATTGADQVSVKWTASAGGAQIAYYVPYVSVNGGAYTAMPAVAATETKMVAATFANTHQFKVKAFDTFGNASADSTASGSITPTGYLADVHINPGNVGTVSLTNQAANDAKVKLTSSTTSGTIGAGATVDFVIPAKATGVRVQQTDAAGHLQMYAASSTTGNGVAIKNIDAVSHNYSFQCYYIDT